eukprot:3212413-Lingulodinium_polyedra.AAC.1
MSPLLLIPGLLLVPWMMCNCFRLFARLWALASDADDSGTSMSMCTHCIRPVSIQLVSPARFL